MTASPYRTLFTGRLVQDSALSIGGTDDPFATVDSPLCRDGAGRPTLRGTSLAGALIGTMRRLGLDPPLEISGIGETVDGTKFTIPSVWRFFNSHPVSDDRLSAPEMRQHVAIDERTGAAAEEALFAVETLARGVTWPFLLEVDTSRFPEAEALARAALADWEAGRCWIGREVARGLGWLHLEGLEAYRLTTSQLEDWPQAERSADYVGYIAQSFARCKARVDAAVSSPRPLLEISGHVMAGEHGEGYGIDSLSLGGHAVEELSAAWDECFLCPDGIEPDHLASEFKPDFAVATHPLNGRRRPFIPGSSLRGPLRHAAARLLRARRPTGGDRDLLNSLFGVVKEAASPDGRPVVQSGKALFRDAWPNGECRLAWLQMHAEDEFTAGAYASSKFDRVAVLAGRFDWKIAVDTPSEAEEQLLRDALNLAVAGQIAVGGAQWRGHGWLQWHIQEWRRC